MTVIFREKSFYLGPCIVEEFIFIENTMLQLVSSIR